MMKLFAFLFSVLVFTANDNIEEISWNSTQFNFGEIQQNIPANASYELTNNTEELLFIKDIKVGCGCTTSDYSKEAISPGESTVINATYNAKKVGVFNKTVSVFTNLNEEPTVLHFTGEVIAN